MPIRPVAMDGRAPEDEQRRGPRRLARRVWSAMRALGRALFAVVVYVLDVLNAGGGPSAGI